MNKTQAKNNYMATFVATFGILLATTILFNVSADETDVLEENQTKQEWTEKKEEIRGNMEAIKTAIEEGDYETWAQLVSENPMGEKIEVSESVFNTFQKAHELKEAGDMEGAREVMQELGIDIRGHHGKGHRLQIHNQEARNALETGDYEAFLEATEKEITQEQFEALIELHELREQMKNDELTDEEKEEIKSQLEILMEESGFEHRDHFGRGGKMSELFSQLSDEQKEVLDQIMKNNEDHESSREAAKEYLKGLGIEMPERPIEQ